MFESLREILKELFSRGNEDTWIPKNKKVYKYLGKTDKQYVHISFQSVYIVIKGVKYRGSFKRNGNRVEIRTKDKNLVVPLKNCSFSIRTLSHINYHQNTTDVEEKVICMVKKYSQEDLERFNR